MLDNLVYSYLVILSVFLLSWFWIRLFDLYKFVVKFLFNSIGKFLLLMVFSGQKYFFPKHQKALQSCLTGLSVSLLKIVKKFHWFLSFLKVCFIGLRSVLVGTVTYSFLTYMVIGTASELILVGVGIIAIGTATVVGSYFISNETSSVSDEIREEQDQIEKLKASKWKPNIIVREHPYIVDRKGALIRSAPFLEDDGQLYSQKLQANEWYKRPYNEEEVLEIDDRVLRKGIIYQSKVWLQLESELSQDLIDPEKCGLLLDSRALRLRRVIEILQKKYGDLDFSKFKDFEHKALTLGPEDVKLTYFSKLLGLRLEYLSALKDVVPILTENELKLFINYTNSLILKQSYKSMLLQKLCGEIDNSRPLNEKMAFLKKLFSSWELQRVNVDKYMVLRDDLNGKWHKLAFLFVYPESTFPHLEGDALTRVKALSNTIREIYSHQNMTSNQLGYYFSLRDAAFFQFKEKNDPKFFENLIDVFEDNMVKFNSYLHNVKGDDPIIRKMFVGSATLTEDLFSSFHLTHPKKFFVDSWIDHPDPMVSSKLMGYYQSLIIMEKKLYLFKIFASQVFASLGKNKLADAITQSVTARAINLPALGVWKSARPTCEDDFIFHFLRINFLERMNLPENHQLFVSYFYFFTDRLSKAEVVALADWDIPGLNRDEYLDIWCSKFLSHLQFISESIVD